MIRTFNILLIGISFLLLSNCANDDNGGTSQVALSGFQAIIDDEIITFQYDGGASMNSNGRHLSIPAVDSEGNQITIFIGDTDMDAPILTEGTYTADSNNFVAFAIDVANTFPDTQIYIIGGNNGSGEITIENLDTNTNNVTVRFNGIAGDLDGNVLIFSDGIAENISYDDF